MGTGTGTGRRTVRKTEAWRLGLVAMSALVALVFLGCPAHTDYNGAQRLTDHTAYTLHPGETRLGLGLVGSEYDDFIIDIPVEYGPLPGFEIGTNAGHDLLGMLNFHAKYTPFEHRLGAVGVRVGLKWFNPHNLWWLGDESRQDMDLGGVDVNVFLVPVRVVGSFPVARWVTLHAELDYLFSRLDGSGDAEDWALSSAGVGGHEIAVRAGADFYPGRGWALRLGVEFPLYGYYGGNAAGSTLIAPGVEFHPFASENYELDVLGLWTLHAAAQVSWEHFNLRMYVTYGMRFLTESMKFPLPGLEMYWRF